MYVLSDKAAKPWQEAHHDRVPVALLKSVVSGAVASREPLTASTAAYIRRNREEHLWSVPQHLTYADSDTSDPELRYHSEAYVALCDVIPADAAPWRSR